jgi:predicted 2-oxoglutarate/Fe(II)-dependent dioxygenase YbiX
MIQDLGNNIFMYKNIMGGDLDVLKEVNSIFIDYNRGFTESTMNDGDYDKALRSCTVFSLYSNKQEDVDYNNLKKILNKKIDIAVSKCILDFIKKTGIKIKEREPWEVLKYEKGQMVTWHCDDGEVHPSKVSFVYYINDDYEGGEIQFKNKVYNMPIKPSKDSLIIFPSGIDYIHRVLPVIEGTKYSVISFGK